MATLTKSSPAAKTFLSSGLLYAFPLAMFGLILAEVTALTLLFDGHALDAWTDWLTRRASQVVNIAITGCAAILVFGDLRGGMSSLARDFRPRSFRLAYVGVHLFCFAALLGSTALLFRDDARHWIFLWVGAVAATAASWALAFAPISAWISAASKHYPLILVASTVGLVGFLVAELTQRLWVPMDQWTFLTVDLLLRWLTTDIVADPERYLLGTSKFAVVIQIQCSGYEGLGLVWSFLGIYLWYARRSLRFPQAWLMLPVATALAWLANAGRIAGLIAIGSWVSADIARGGFHSKAGWIGFNLVALGSVLALSHWRFFRREPEEFRSMNPATPWLAPWTIWLALTLLTGAFIAADQPDYFYPVRVVIVGAVLYLHRGFYAGLFHPHFLPPVAIGVCVALTWMLFADASGDSSSAWLSIGTGRKAALLFWIWSGSRAIGYVLIVPMIEELAFRGYLLQRFVAPRKDESKPYPSYWLPLLISSVLFGAMHGANWLPGILAGLLFGVAAVRRNYVGDAVVAHVTANGLLAIVAISTGKWHLLS